MDEETKCIIKINSYEFICNKKSVMEISKIIKQYFDQNQDSRKMSVIIEKIDNIKDLSFSEFVFENKKIENISYENLNCIYEIALYFEIEAVIDYIHNINNKIDHFLSQHAGINELIQLEKTLMDLKEESFDTSVKKCLKHLNIIDKLTFINAILQICLFSIENKHKLVLKLFNMIDAKTNGNLTNSLIEVSLEIFAKSRVCEMSFFIHFLLEENLIKPEEIGGNIKLSFIFIDFFKENRVYRSRTITEDKKENNFKLHKLLCNEGHNPIPILHAIRNDDVDLLQKLIIANADVNTYNGLIIPKSFYERITFINDGICTFLDYSSFYGSIKCFKFFITNYLNDVNVDKLSLYAVSGGNLEIIHICNQYRFSFHGALAQAIKYHRHNLYSWIYENNLDSPNKEHIRLAVEANNFHYIQYAVHKFFNIEDMLIVAVENNNEIIANFSIKLREELGFSCIKYEKEILFAFKMKLLFFSYITAILLACQANNSKMVQILLNNTKIDYNKICIVFFFSKTVQNCNFSS